MDKTEKETPNATIYSCSPSTRQREIMGFVNDIDVKELEKKLYDKKGYNMLIGSTTALVFGIFYFTHLNLGTGILFLVFADAAIILASLIGIIPASVFGRFYKQYHVEYLQWLSFKHMLLDFAQIKRYLKEDYRQWRTWIVYATALGAAENLLKAMKELRLLTAAEYNNVSNVNSTAIWFAASSSPKGGGGGIGGGGGGGFGGGGGGGR